MTYVLISLPGDQASREAADFGAWFAQRRQPDVTFSEAAPDHSAVRTAVARTRCAVVFGHNGGGALRASAGGAPWAGAQEMGQVFGGARVYAFACNTMGEHSADGLRGLGVDAVRAGVHVFAGHPTFVPADTGQDPRGKFHHAIRQAIAAVIVEFLDGCSDEAVLRLRAERSFDIVAERFGVWGGAPGAIRAAMTTLRVVSR